MIHINSVQIHFSREWEERARQLTLELMAKAPDERAAFIEAKRVQTWGDHDLLESLRSVVGNKCWYSEVSLSGADPNIDHFRPKGRVVEVDNDTFEKTGNISDGYWWLAFEPKNYRLSCMHSNQRRVDEQTAGGKWDFFPVVGLRAPEGTEWDLIGENVLPFDPCSAIDMALMWFDPDGKPGLRRQKPSAEEVRRLKVTTWLFHLDKKETAQERSAYVEGIRKDLKTANIAYKLWNPHGGTPNLVERGRFDAALAEIRAKIADDAVFAGAKRCAVQLAKADYLWIEEFNVI
jgi:hypothetical protein